MSTKEDLETESASIFSQTWAVSDGRIVPKPEDLTLGNDARYFDRATVLYADLSGSTALVNAYHWQVAGEIYKTYLSCAAKIIRLRGGVITAYDGDRIMGVFIGSSQTSNAARCALEINWAVKNVVNPALRTQYPSNGYTIKQVVGIDTSEIRAARIGVRGGNDLVWIGRAANYAAKLTECRNDVATWVTKEAYKFLNKNSIYGANGENMWKKYTWTQNNDVEVYGSTWLWAL